MTGRPLESVEFGLARLRRWEERLRGCCVCAVHSRGKALLTHFDNGLTLYSHNQLYGRWVVCPRDDPPKTGRSLRVALHTATHSALLYSASEIEVLDADALAAHPFLARLGPDVLDEALVWRDVAERLSNERFARRSLAALYLDQGFLAGIGNYLRSEILHASGAHPHTRAATLSRVGRGRLARATLSISRRAYATGGITVAPALVATLKRQGYPRRDYRFAVFAREGLPCYRCGGSIRRILAGSRRLYFCPVCQPAGDG
jgi:endonuclease-8